MLRIATLVCVHLRRHSVGGRLLSDGGPWQTHKGQNLREYEAHEAHVVGWLPLTSEVGIGTEMLPIESSISGMAVPYGNDRRGCEGVNGYSARQGLVWLRPQKVRRPAGGGPRRPETRLALRDGGKWRCTGFGTLGRLPGWRWLVVKWMCGCRAFKGQSSVASAFHESMYLTVGGAGMARFALARMRDRRLQS